MSQDARRPGDELIFVDPQAYRDATRWHAAAERLRRHDPLPWVRAEGFVPFRAVTRHAHVEEIERNHDRFHNTMESVLLTAQELLQNGSVPSREQIREHISGNYCRCTGYHAIVDAIESVAQARAAKR